MCSKNLKKIPLLFPLLLLALQLFFPSAILDQKFYLTIQKKSVLKSLSNCIPSKKEVLLRYVIILHTYYEKNRCFDNTKYTSKLSFVIPIYLISFTKKQTSELLVKQRMNICETSLKNLFDWISKVSILNCNFQFVSIDGV